MFPYHYGSYATETNQRARYHEPRCFHTTMVLTQPECSEKKTDLCYVSIPLWFLRNLHGLRYGRACKGVFPYHYGSYATWDSDIQESHSPSFPYHYGSYATQEGRCGTPHSVTFPYHYGSYATREPKVLWRLIVASVSIPLWFLRNEHEKLIINVKQGVSIPLWFLRNMELT